MSSEGTLIPVDIHLLRKTTRDIDFDIYIKLSADNIVHLFSSATGLDYKRLAHYVQSGVTHLHVRDKDYKKFQRFVSRSAESILTDPKTVWEKRVAALVNMTEQNIAEICSQLDLEDDTASTAQKL